MKQIDRLAQISSLILDVKLSALQKAGRAREESLAHLAALQVAPSTDPDPIAAAQVEVRYQLWADAKRAEINTTLARQTAEWMEARDHARHAFGQAEALRKLRDR